MHVSMFDIVKVSGYYLDEERARPIISLYDATGGETSIFLYSISGVPTVNVGAVIMALLDIADEETQLSVHHATSEVCPGHEDCPCFGWGAEVGRER